MIIGDSRKRKTTLKMEISMLKFNFILSCRRQFSCHFIKETFDIITEEN